MCLYVCVRVFTRIHIHADVSIHVLVCALKFMYNLYVCVRIHIPS